MGSLTVTMEGRVREDGNIYKRDGGDGDEEEWQWS